MFAYLLNYTIFLPIFPYKNNIFFKNYKNLFTNKRSYDIILTLKNKGLVQIMISFLEGIVKLKTNSFIIINVNGIGFKLFMSENSLNQIDNNQSLKVYTYMRVLQDDISLFGFLNYEELSMFELLISVSGIGAKSAINILSKIEPSKFALAKSAQRIILELKDKIKTEQAESKNEEIINKIKNVEKAQDAIDALQVLGYNRKDVEKVINQIDELDELSTEEIIKKGLKLL